MNTGQWAGGRGQDGKESAIQVRDVHKTYRRYSRRKQFATLKSAFLSGSVLKDLRPDAVFEALKGVSFDVAKGKTFGIVGRNGSGKSTMLKLIAGIGKPTAETRPRTRTLPAVGGASLRSSSWVPAFIRRYLVARMSTSMD